MPNPPDGRSPGRPPSRFARACNAAFTGTVVAVFAFQNARRFFGNGFVALAGQDVEHRTGADNLRGRSHQRDKAEVLAHAGFSASTRSACPPRSAASAGLRGWSASAPGFGPPEYGCRSLSAWPSRHGIFARLAEVRGDALQLQDIQPGVMLSTCQRRHQRLGGRVAVGGAHGGNRRVDAVDARLVAFSRAISAIPVVA